MERHGADGLAIVATIGLLIGLITAFQAAIQLRKFGADTLVATLVGLSLTRELAPLMTAIVVAGRSGAAIAAELGTMKVSEEVDALKTLGLDPYRYLVLPRCLALVLVLPLLTIVADIIGLLGGALVALSTLEVSLQGYVLATRDALGFRDVLGGLIKAAAFGGIISLVACERGLATSGGAEGVGRATTGAVVKTLFYLVVADAFFAVLFNVWGI
jgi:phospholipid/cholesterol/gamma-HCH transport system permease protein